MAAHAANKYGKLPLHNAVTSHASAGVIETLLEVHLEALLQKDLSGSTPLHYAFIFNASHETIELLGKGLIGIFENRRLRQDSSSGEVFREIVKGLGTDNECEAFLRLAAFLNDTKEAFESLYQAHSEAFRIDEMSLL